MMHLTMEIYLRDRTHGRSFNLNSLNNLNNLFKLNNLRVIWPNV